MGGLEVDDGVVQAVGDRVVAGGVAALEDAFDVVHDVAQERLGLGLDRVGPVELLVQLAEQLTEPGRVHRDGRPFPSISRLLSRAL
jgi:hypothetical protein